MLGREPRRFGRINWPLMRRRAAAVLEQLHLDIDPTSPLESHSIAVQQLVSIARAMEIDAQVLILDEPTSSLDTREVEELFAVVERVRDAGVAVVFITHFLDQVYRIADRITVLRNGRLVGEHLTAELPRIELVSKMIGQRVGRPRGLGTGRSRVRQGTAAADVPRSHRARPQVRRRSARSPDPHRRGARDGRAAGLGRTETARLLFGADRADSGTITVEGQPVRLRNPRVALDKGIAYTSENRRIEGLVGNLSVRSNIVLAMQSAAAGRGRSPAASRPSLPTSTSRRSTSVHPIQRRSWPTCPVATSRRCCWLAGCSPPPSCSSSTNPRRGIDVGAKAEIQRLVAALADDGIAVVFISAELEEVLRLSHRIVVMRELHKVAEIENQGTTESDLMRIIAEGAETVAAAEASS